VKYVAFQYYTHFIGLWPFYDLDDKSHISYFSD
jgi:hypothetical protein